MVEKKIKGRKRHSITDTDGHLLHVKVHAANIHDTKAGGKVVEETLAKYPSLLAFCGDAGYRKSCKNYVETVLLKKFEISKKITDGWAVIAKRWVVERTFGWQNWFRRLSKDYELHTHSAENMVRISMMKLLLDRCF